MMPSFDFLFLIRLSAIWSLLLLFYFLALRKNDNWPLKRYFILAAYTLGWVLPLLPTIYEHTAIVNYSLGNQIANNTFIVSPSEQVVEAEATTFWTWQTLLIGAYLTICLGLTLRMLRSFLLLRYWRRNGLRSSFQNYTLVQHAKIKVPVAGFNTIFLPLNLSTEEAQMACLHEKLHLQQGHQWERLPLLLGHIFLWFHPLQWLFQYLQEQIQEYEVDEGVLQRFSLSEYGKLLIQASMAPTMSWHPNLFSSPLKNRIDMMCKVKNKQSWRFYHTLMLSLLLGFIVVSCTDLIDSNAAESYELVSAEELDQIAQVANPEYQNEDPMRNLFEGIGRNVKYPLEAREKNIEGTVVVEYVIDADGDMQDLVILRPTTPNYKPYQVNASFMDEIVITGYNISNEPPLLERNLTKEEVLNELNVFRQEVTRVIENLSWKPALKNGKPVASIQRLPIRFRLQ